MFIAKYTDPNGISHCNLYDSFPAYFSDTFSPECEEHFLLDFVVHGKTYAEKKASVKSIAIDFSHLDTGADFGLSWGEISDITAWFELNARRYGLTEEFKENCII